MTPLVRLRCAAFLFLAALVLVVSGCGGGKGAKVKGKLILPAGVTPAAEDTVQVTLVGKDANFAMQAKSTEGGNYSFETAGKEGVPPGEYKVAVMVRGYPGAKQAPPAGYDKINREFSEQVTPLKVTIEKASEQSFTVDLAAKSVSKN
jgi:hypothetical protein